MKTTILFPVCFLVFLSACGPRDVKFIDKSSAGRKNSNSASGKSGALNLSDLATATHLVERQLEALSILELSPENAEGMGYIASTQGSKTVYNRFFGYAEKANNSVLTSNEAWAHLADQNKYVSPMTSRTLTTAGKAQPGSDPTAIADVVIIEKQRVITISPKGDKLEIGYNIDDGMISQNSESQLFKIVGTMIVQKKGPGHYLIHESSFTGHNKRASDADKDWFRNMTVTTLANSPVEVRLGDCPTITGKMATSYTIPPRISGAMELDFTGAGVAQTSGRGAPSQSDFVSCENNQKRPILDFSRFLGK